MVHQPHRASEALQKFDVFFAAIAGAMQASQERFNGSWYAVGFGCDLDRYPRGAVPVAVSRDVPLVNGQAWYIVEGVELFGADGVVHGWNKTGFSGKLDKSAVGVDLISELVCCPRHRVIHDCGVHVVAVFEAVSLSFESLER